MKDAVTGRKEAIEQVLWAESLLKIVRGPTPNFLIEPLLLATSQIVSERLRRESAEGSQNPSPNCQSAERPSGKS